MPAPMEPNSDTLVQMTVSCTLRRLQGFTMKPLCRLTAGLKQHAGRPFSRALPVLAGACCSSIFALLRTKKEPDCPGSAVLISFSGGFFSQSSASVSICAWRSASF